MKLERTKNAARNIVFGGIQETVNMLFPFVIRSVMLHYLGTQYLGLNGLFKSLLMFLNLAELGVGSAMGFSMYKPIAEDDTPAICALLRLYRTLYRIIGLAIAAVGLLIIPVLHILIRDDLPAGMNLYGLYLMNLGNTVLTYWLFAYKGSLLQAHQRRDMISRETTYDGLIQEYVDLNIDVRQKTIEKEHKEYLLSIFDSAARGKGNASTQEEIRDKIGHCADLATEYYQYVEDTGHELNR